MKKMHITSVQYQKCFFPVPTHNSFKHVEDVFEEICNGFLTISSFTLGKVYSRILSCLHKNRGQYIPFIEKSKSYEDILRHKIRFEAQKKTANIFEKKNLCSK